MSFFQSRKNIAIVQALIASMLSFYLGPKIGLSEDQANGFAAFVFTALGMAKPLAIAHEDNGRNAGAPVGEVGKVPNS